MLGQLREVVISILEVQDTQLPQLKEIFVLTEDKWRRSVFAGVFSETSKACHAQGISFNMD